MDRLEISKKLITLREKMQLTQQEVANKVGVSVSAITNYEVGNRIPKDNIKIKLASLYGVSVEEIFFRVDDTKRV